MFIGLSPRPAGAHYGSRAYSPTNMNLQVAKMLGSPKAMERMRAYLYNVKPKSAELIVDEALAICSDIERWRDKKAAEEANMRYNEILYYGLGNDDEE